MSDFVLAIGASLMDTKGVPHQGLEPSTSNPALIRSTRGGTARNVAENLGRLGVEVALISAVGEDTNGRYLLDITAEAGVDVSAVRQIPHGRTGQYMAVIDQSGHLSVALDDTSVMTHLTPDYLRQQEHLFQAADMIMIDGGLTLEALLTAMEMGQAAGVPLCVDPSSTRLASRLCPHLDKISLIVPNEREAAAICNADYPTFDIDASLNMARSIKSRGVDQIIITLSDFGLVYVTAEESGYLPAHYSDMVDSTGTGDAIAAAVILGRLNNLPSVECMRLGTAAAGLTLQTADSVVRDLSLDMLYSHLTL